MNAKPTTIDEYLSRLTAAQRAVLSHLRTVIRAAAPDAEECISYDMPTYRLDGRMLLSFAAATKHCALHIGAHPLAVHARELERYDTTKGAVRFPPSQPLPDALVRKLVKTRIAERRRQRSTKPPKRR
ncbi:MAG TPA: DUF1801 domain-containing protein [Gemmatimonadaceae bacterium]|nr:DUF1801 domain-containing protein [Gemmatimonadaceae bacterium]